jgi:hypothetical protein
VALVNAKQLSKLQAWVLVSAVGLGFVLAGTGVLVWGIGTLGGGP